MERQDPEGSYPAIEVLDGQASVEDLLADLGFEWRVESSDPGRADEPFSQPALF
ncbi:hypothetical protein [Arthrobacter nitrophenolicus]|uniref:hypothetical protein n=1 Tax=Arthrobacter nitrophenolicus TaxID=683150 RepID=UPI0014052582|nr:hypothetical protein [Arthrobacter nitrophenolicus]